MRTSEIGIADIKLSEGLRLEAYPDPAHGWARATIGYGHTSAAGPPQVRRGMRIDEAEATVILRRDLRKTERAINRLVRVPLSQGQFDALVSFAFNLGSGALRGSTLLAKLNAGDYRGAEREFGRWVHAGGRRMPGLVKRRRREARRFAGTSRTYQAAGVGLVGQAGQAAAGGALIAGFSGYELVGLARDVSGLFAWGKWALVACLVLSAGATVWGLVRTIWAKADDRRTLRVAHGEIAPGPMEDA